nr:MAG TPA: hypothetical protein [Caudoviricetes sp.]
MHITVTRCGTQTINTGGWFGTAISDMEKGQVTACGVKRPTSRTRRSSPFSWAQ